MSLFYNKTTILIVAINVVFDEIRCFGYDVEMASLLLGQALFPKTGVLRELRATYTILESLVPERVCTCMYALIHA